MSTRRSEPSVTNAKTNKRKHDKSETSKTEQSQCTVGKTEALYRNNNNNVVSESNTVNCELRYRLRSLSGNLPKEKQPKEKLTSNKKNVMAKSDDFLEISSDFVVIDATQSRFKENFDNVVPIQRRYAIDFPVKS